ncbi:hypothetical protein AAFF_G00097490, partial [Aldrovandia affinis]
MGFLPSFSTETWTLLALFLTLLVTYGVWPYRVFKKLGIPGPRPLPFIGNLSFRRSFMELEMEWCLKYGKVWGIYEGRIPIMMISDPTMIKTIMVKECYTVFTNRRDIFESGALSDAVSIAKDEKWRRIRSALSPSFTSGRLKDVFPIVLKYADALIDNLKKRDLKQPINVKDLLAPYSMDVVTSSSFSVEVDSINNPKDPFVTNMKKLFDFGPLLLLTCMFH